MRPTHRVARRIFGTAFGLTALASLLLPGPASAVASAAGTPLEPEALSTAAVGTEHPVAEPGPPAPARADGEPDTAFGDDVFLTAWPDQARQIRVTHVSHAGDVLDPTGISLDRGHFGYDPEVAFDGTNFLVGWWADGAVVAKRVSPEGDVLDESNIVVSADGSSPAIDFDGTNFLVVWSVSSTPGSENYDIVGRRVSPAGRVVDATDLTISAAPAAQSNVDIAYNGTHHLLVWENANADVYGTLVDRAGVPTNASGVPITSARDLQLRPAVTSVGPSFFVAWGDARNGGAGSDIYGTRVSPTGAVIDPSGIAIATGPSYDALPGVASDGTDVLAAWAGQGEARFARIDASGTVSPPSGTILPRFGSAPRLAFDGTNYLAVGADNVVDSRKVRGTRISATGDVLDPDGFAVSALPNAQHELDSAYDGTNTFVVWTDDRYDGGRIYGGRLDEDGELLDGSGIAISAEPNLPDTTVTHHTAPAVAFDGTNHLVVWLDNTPEDVFIRGARVSTAGEVIERFDIDVLPRRIGNDPAVAFGGGVFLVTWTETDAGTPNSEIHAVRVSTDGDVLDPASVKLNESFLLAGEPAVAYGASAFLVVWEQSEITTAADIRGALVSPSGVVTRPGGGAVSTAEDDQRAPDVAWNGDQYLVVWQDERASGSGPFAPGPSDVYGTRVDGAGTVLDPAGIPVSTDPADQQAPSVAANGRFFVAWTDRRYGTGPDILGTRVEGDGTVGRPSGQFISNAATAEGSPSVAPAAESGTFSVAYTRYVAPRQVDRAFVRHVSPK